MLRNCFKSISNITPNPRGLGVGGFRVRGLGHTHSHSHTHTIQIHTYIPVQALLRGTKRPHETALELTDARAQTKMPFGKRLAFRV